MPHPASSVGAHTGTTVGVDERWENLKRVQGAGWKVSADHPDTDPAHEAVQLLELFREAVRLPAVQEYPDEFRRWLADAEQSASDLEKLLRHGPGKAAESEAKQVFGKLGASCGWKRPHASPRNARPGKRPATARPPAGRRVFNLKGPVLAGPHGYSRALRPCAGPRRDKHVHLHAHGR
jgi:hypothetical protein